MVCKGEYFDGKIAFSHGNGVYNIEYDDGDFEENVPSRLIRPLNKVLEASTKVCKSIIVIILVCQLKSIQTSNAKLIYARCPRL